jgi:hypothetical protein
MVNLEELDPPVRWLVSFLNELPGIATLSSCGGHAGGEAPADEWYVHLELEPADAESEIAAPSERAWLSLEFVAWQTYGPWGNHDVRVVAYANPPHINFPGRMLRFELSGRRSGDDGVEPDALALAMRRDWYELTDELT